MAIPKPHSAKRYTIAQYTRLEERSDQKHEWHDGEILAMSGRSYEHAMIATNPRVIIEVLSPTTESYDRGEKFDHYRDLGSLQEYILVAQSAPRVEIYLRQPDRSWNFTPFVGIETAVIIQSVRIEIPLVEIYASVTFPPPPEPPEEQNRIQGVIRES